MPNQPGKCRVKVHREKPNAELGKMSFYGQPGHCIGAYYFEERN